MKRIYNVIFFVMVSFCVNANVRTLEINQGWKFKQARLDNWYEATVPGVVHTDLIANGLIEDPFFRLNERGVQWVDKEDWIYETVFDVTREFWEMENILLNFKGIDTYGDVYLNDEKVIVANNMFREWKVDVKKILREKGNILRVYFHSPIKVDLPKFEALPYKYEAINDQSYNGGLLDRQLSVFARKAGYHYGWDWGPRLVTSGIWRPVYLEGWDNAKFENIWIRQDEVVSKKAAITTVVEILSDKEFKEVVITVSDKETNKELGRLVTSLKKGKNKVEVPFQIKNPELWWSNGLGEAHLYCFETKLLDGKSLHTIDSHVQKTGLRSLKVIHKPDVHGTSFFFELNGIPVFAKGANYIPCDNFLPRVTPEIYRKTILDAVNANMNMLRVWGGGIYENDLFYELCDEYGIIVWQDFMFACSIYPAEGDLLENIRKEAVENVRRLRNYACIGIWCGNNECNDAWFGWGWNKRYEKSNPEYDSIIHKQLCDQYYVVLPEAVAQNSNTFYWPSSPFASYDGVSDTKNGDRHYWDVWHGKQPISKYNEERSRFFSEYGFQSFPEYESVKLYAPLEKDWDIKSEVMMSHQRGGAFANELIESYLLSEYRKPTNFEEFLYMNHVLQGDAIKTAIEAHRRDMPYCMGSLFWQHNDCWPVASWSSRDYYGRWKAQHYFACESFRDILVSPILKDSTLNVFIVSDKNKNTRGELIIDIITMDGKSVFHKELPVKLDNNSSAVYFSSDINMMLKQHSPEDVVVLSTFKERGGETFSNQYFLVKQKDVNYHRNSFICKVDSVKNGFNLTVESDKYARAVFLSIDGIDNFFENNYFDLLPNKPINLFVSSSLSKSDFEKQLKIRSLNGEVN